MKVIVLLASMVFSGAALADGIFQTSTASYCHDASVKRVSVPVFPNRADSPVYDYAYKVFEKDPRLTTVILLPGGPGATLIDQPEESPVMPGLSPFGAIDLKRFNLVYTDPRGAGCNQLASGDFPYDAFQLRYLANDVLSIVRDLGLKNYIIYGASFGTVLGTVAASLAPIEALSEPKALVLEGIVGRGYPTMEDYFRGYQIQWERERKNIPNTTLALLDDRSDYLGVLAEDWGNLLFGLLVTGNTPKKGDILATVLAPLAGQPTESIQALKSIVSIAREAINAVENSRLFLTLACNEMGDQEWIPGVVLDHGQLHSEGPNLCQNIPRLSGTKLYDSAAWPVSAPIYYFQGNFDPATQLNGALHHFKNQKYSDRRFVLVDRAAHDSLSTSLSTLGCAPSVWSSIDQLSDKELKAALDSCHWKINLRHRRPS